MDMKYVEASKKVFLNTGARFQKEVIRSLALLKKGAAISNMKLGLLPEDLARAIADASDEVAQGTYDSKVEVDVYQTGSGTGLNMNLNELIAARASETLGRPVHPNDHVNMGQSSNDVVPSAIRVATLIAYTEYLKPALRLLSSSLGELSDKFSGVYKSGRTHLRDALPVTLGQEFGAYFDAFKLDAKVLEFLVDSLSDLPLGGTAVGTGLNSQPGFAELVVSELNQYTGLKFRISTNKFRSMRLLTDLAAFSAQLSVSATNLYRLSQDIRLMFSGPVTGFNEIDIPSQEEVAGSSIMPGKTNPVTVEAAMLASAEVSGLDLANRQACMYGEFELAMGVPLLGYNLVSQIRLLSEAFSKMTDVVLKSIKPNQEKLRWYAENSPSLITVLSPVIGYDKASVVGKKIVKGVGIRQALHELGYDDQEIERLLELDELVKAGIPSKHV
jgi:fumarate hydratase class II